MNDKLIFQNSIYGILLFLAALTVGMLGGLIASTGNLLVIALIVVVLVGIILMSKPTILMMLVLLGGLVIVGLVQLYLPQLQIIRWGISFISIILGGMALLQYYFVNNRDTQFKLPSTSWWLLAFLIFSLFSSMANFVEIGTFAVGFKGYFQIWGLFIALMLMRWPPRVIDGIPRFLIILAFVQLPFVAHQYLVLVPKRMGLGHGIIPEDVIAGTFGASLLGGGANAVLSAFMFIVLAILTSYWKRGLLSSTRLAIAYIALLSPMLINLSKISLFYLLLVFVVIFRDDIVKKPGKFIIGSAFTVIFMFIMLGAYTFMHPDSERGATLQDLIDKTIQDNTSSEAGYGSLELNRFTSMTFWIEEHVARKDIVRALIGHGLGEAREGEGGTGLASTLAQNKYTGMGIGLTSITALLWETGIIGLGLVLLAFWAAYKLAGRLADFYQEDTKLSATLHGMQAGVAVLILSLAHKNAFVFHLPYQTVVMLIFGYIAYWDIQSKIGKPRI